MSVIKVGSVWVPIISEVEFSTNNPTSDPTVPLPDIVARCFPQGIEVGQAYNGEYPDGQIYTSCEMLGGRTGMHDVSGELIIAITSRNTTLFPDNNTYNMGVTIVNDGSQLYTTQFDFIKTANALLSNKYRNYYTNLVAVRFYYPNAETEGQRQYGYKVFALAKIINYDTSTGIETTSYDTYGYFIINIPYLNKIRNSNLYIEEQEPPEPDEPPFDPTEDPNPYTPNIDDTSDLIGIPSNPLIGITNAGFINVYKPAMGALQGLGDILFPNVASATDVMDAILKLCETLANQNLINYVIDCHVIPVTPQIGNNANIKVGFRDTGISVPVVTSDYIDVSCGSLNIQEYFGGFQDYQATHSKIYLPFVGFVDTKPEYWQSGTISVDYKFNVIDGSFMCYIRSASSKSQLAGSVIAQYAGNACMHFPITGVNYASMVSGLIGAAVGAAPKVGNVSPTLGAAYSAANTIAQGGDIQQSNGYNSTAALLGVRTPYLLIERAVPAYPAKYAHDKGFPTNITTMLSNVTGYTEIEDIDLSGIPFTADELTELKQLLADGVYF